MSCLFDSFPFVNTVDKSMQQISYPLRNFVRKLWWIKPYSTMTKKIYYAVPINNNACGVTICDNLNVLVNKFGNLEIKKNRDGALHLNYLIYHYYYSIQISFFPVILNFLQFFFLSFFFFIFLQEMLILTD